MFSHSDEKSNNGLVSVDEHRAYFLHALSRDYCRPAAVFVSLAELEAEWGMHSICISGGARG